MRGAGRSAKPPPDLGEGRSARPPAARGAGRSANPPPPALGAGRSANPLGDFAVDGSPKLAPTGARRSSRSSAAGADSPRIMAGPAARAGDRDGAGRSLKPADGRLGAGRSASSRSAIALLCGGVAARVGVALALGRGAGRSTMSGLLPRSRGDFGAGLDGAETPASGLARRGAGRSPRLMTSPVSPDGGGVAGRLPGIGGGAPRAGSATIASQPTQVTLRAPGAMEDSLKRCSVPQAAQVTSIIVANDTPPHDASVQAGAVRQRTSQG